ncbi:MAG: efflux RND transporter periplasmic adaptor subunit [Deltaproteobacteria bacterium]|nr:MAG: efflux RND transporter periplasmic adaptor subunit [Deltaproteobacteria bacterium]
MNPRLKVIVPLLVLLAGITTAAVLLITRPQAAPRPTETPAPMVRVQTARPIDVTLIVRTYGTVVPAAEIELIPEVSGRVERVDPALAGGGFFRRGQVLLDIDPRDYQLAVEAAAADVATAEVRLTREQAEADIARREWEALHAGEPAPPLVLREPQLAEARAALAAARARLERARLDLERTQIVAPFDGRVREERVDVGQYVQKGVSLGRIYSVEAAEVRLPLATRDLAYVDLPLPGTGAASPTLPNVRLSAEIGGRQYTWEGRIVRTDGEIDEKTRMIHAVARVERPYDTAGDPKRPPLAVGMFVEAAIEGHRVRGVFAVPPIAMRDDQTVMVVDDESRLRLRRVELLRKETDRVLVSSGLRDGELLCLSPLDVVTDGMPVRVADAADTSKAAP